MSIIRGPRPDSKFYTVSKDISEDRRLSWGARGLLIFLLGKPDFWKVSVKHLISQTEECLGVSSGRDAVRGLIKELEAAGYVQSAVAHGEAGRFAGMEYIVNEVPAPAPQPDSPGTDYPAPAKPAPAKPHIVKTNKKTKTEEEKAKNQLPKIARKGATAPAANRRTQLPADFAPNQQHTELAAQSGLDLKTEVEQFKDHHTANASTMADWNAALRTWLRNAIKWQGKGGIGRTPKNAPAPRQRAANGKLLDDQGKPKDYMKGLGEDGYAKF